MQALQTVQMDVAVNVAKFAFDVKWKHDEELTNNITVAKAFA